MGNFCGRIREAAARFPDHIAIEKVRGEGLDAVSYRALVHQAGTIAAWLGAQGVAAGDRVAILADNDARWIAAYLGTLWIGAMAVPLDTAYKADQVQTIVGHCGARVLFTTPRYLETATRAVEGSSAKAARIVLLEGAASGFPDWTHITAASPTPPLVEDIENAVILYTSGTTADPKGVVLTHANLHAERESIFAVIRVTETDGVLGVLPLFHALAQMANLLLPLTAGARVVFLESISSTTLLEALRTRNITLFACVPQFFYLIHQRVMTEVAKGGTATRTIFRAMLATNFRLREWLGWNPGKRWFARVHHQLGTSMRLLITGGSRFDPAIGRDLHALGFTILNAYGLTETSGGATIVRPGDRFTPSVGKAVPGVEITVQSSKFQVQSSKFEVRNDGEILIRGPIVMREYFNRPDATREAIDADGWLHTGDLGTIDKDGRLSITGRLKEIIVLSSGKNLYPEEIEAHYGQSSMIKELCVMGLARPGEPAAERLHALVVPDEAALRARGVVNIGDLIRFEIETLSAALPAHKRVLSYDITMDPLPRTTTGKLRRPQIEKLARERAATKTTSGNRALSNDEQTWLRDKQRADAVATIASRLNRPSLRPDANLELDLGLDSMERVELLTSLERQSGTTVTPEIRAQIFTVRQLIDAVRAGAPASTPATEADLPWEQLLAEPAEANLTADLRRSRTIMAAVGYAIIQLLAVAARLVPGLRIRGRANVPRSGPCLICPNHQSHLDGFFLVAALPFGVFRRLFFVGAAEYFQTPWRRWLARLSNIVPVDPDANLVSAMKAGATGLRLGKVLMLFPEGERSIDGELKRFRKGAAILAAHTGAPIVPVAIDGLFALWPRGRPVQWNRLLPGRAKPVTLALGAPLTATPGEYDQATAALQNAVSHLMSGG